MITVSKQAKAAIQSTWDSIAHDVYDSCDGDNEIAMELVLDAKRLALWGFEDEQLEVSSLCQTHGYHNVLKALAAQMQLL